MFESWRIITCLALSPRCKFPFGFGKNYRCESLGLRVSSLFPDPVAGKYCYLRTSWHRICDLRYANLSPTALIPYLTHRLSSSPRPLVLNQSSRCMAAQKCQILPYSMSSTLFSRPQISFPLYISNLSPRNIQARLRMVRECSPRQSSKNRTLTQGL